MTAPDELERAVERMEKARKIADQYATGVHFGKGNDGFVSFATILALLSERAELLADVERMRGEIVFATTTLYPEALFRLADTLDRTGAVKETGELLRMMGHNEQVIADRLRAALTTGEEK